ncbi:MAG: hypothetical protein MUF49_31540 [Oculatellaceae cyanobacterium Prado106]|jgi:hypothetical protein|nr:hypothetical protein [Oculatellaceae cyanobacterium Prado106]
MSPQSLFNHYPTRPKHQATINAYLILCSAHKTASSFLEIFISTENTQESIEQSTDEEQDLLRAMLVFASAGLDSMAKQLVSDALPIVIDNNEGAEALSRISHKLNSKRLKPSI